MEMRLELTSDLRTYWCKYFWNYYFLTQYLKPYHTIPSMLWTSHLFQITALSPNHNLVSIETPIDLYFDLPSNVVNSARPTEFIPFYDLFWHVVLLKSSIPYHPSCEHLISFRSSALSPIIIHRATYIWPAGWCCKPSLSNYNCSFLVIAFPTV